MEDSCTGPFSPREECPVHRSKSSYVTELTEARQQITALEQDKADLLKRAIEPSPCPHCQWPMGSESDNWHCICPCCGWERQLDEHLVGPYQWNGEWWFKEEQPPALVVNLQAQVAALTVERDHLKVELVVTQQHKVLSLLGKSEWQEVVEEKLRAEDFFHPLYNATPERIAEATLMCRPVSPHQEK